MTRDEVFVPRTRSQLIKPGSTPKIVKHNGVDMEELLEDAPIYRLAHIVFQQVGRRILYALDRD